MIVSFLMPYRARGDRAIFLWQFYKQIARSRPGEITFIAGEDYFLDPREHVRLRPELENQATRYGFEIPDAATVHRLDKHVVGGEVFGPLNARVNSWDEGFAQLLTTVYEPLRELLDRCLDDIAARNPVEFLVTWCNCPSLSAAAADRNLPVIHNELGPLRSPDFHPTIYFDFSGVNGNTSFSRLAETLVAEEPAWIPEDRAELRRILGHSAPEPSPTAAEYPWGVPLQVEDDSNMLAFSHGWTNFSLLSHARFLADSRQVLARSHPSGHLFYPPYLAVKDLSPSAATFIGRCERILSINSSVALEALLAGKSVRILGEASFACLSEDADFRQNHPAAFPLLLEAYCLCYLVPETLLFDWDYYRWRVGFPSLVEIRARHRAVHRDLPGARVGKTSGTKKPDLPRVNFWDLESENLRQIWDQFEKLGVSWRRQKQRIGELEKTLASVEKERDQFWNEIQSLGESWKCQVEHIGNQDRQLGATRAECERLGKELQTVGKSWEAQHDHITALRKELEKTRTERDRFWRELQDVGRSWTVQADHITRQKAELANLYAEQTVRWEELQKVGKSWEAQAAFIARQKLELERLRSAHSALWDELQKVGRSWESQARYIAALQDEATALKNRLIPLDTFYCRGAVRVVAGIRSLVPDSLRRKTTEAPPHRL